MTFRDAVSHLLVSEGLLALAISRLEDGKLNSRGFSNPWKASRFNYRAVWKTGISIPMDFKVLGHVAVPRLYRRHFFFSFVPTDLKVRGYSPSASRLVRRLFFVCHV